MEREFILLPEFDRQWAKLGFNDDDLIRLQEEIKKDPNLGTVIVGTGGIRKMRFAFKGRGKSGSARILYIDILVTEKVLLLGAYAKNEQETLSDKEKDYLKNMATEIVKYYNR